MEKRILALVLCVCMVLMGTCGALAEALVYDEPRVLRIGDRDGDDSSTILQLQNKLIALGYLNGTADGVFGENTRAAIIALQESNGLTATGEVTPELHNMLDTSVAFASKKWAVDTDSLVYRTQETLGQWGFLAGAADGEPGPSTNEAIAAFKTYLSLHSKKYPLERAVAALAQDGDMPLAVDVKSDTTATFTRTVQEFIEGEREFDIFEAEVKLDDTGSEVERVQRRLCMLKYLAAVDGSFGEATELALSYFQRQNSLPETGKADEKTQRVLFSSTAVPSDEYVNRYKIIVNVTKQHVYAYEWNGSSYSAEPVKDMICSTGKYGKSTETPLGTYQAAGPTGTGEWYWFEKYTCYAKWATRIIGGILFHSVIYSKGKSLNRTSVKKLGSRASHGCIRLGIEDAKWVYDNCTPGTTVIVMEEEKA